MKSTWFGCRRRYNFARCIHDADYSRQMWDNFSSFLTIAFYSFRQANHKMLTGTMNHDYEQQVVREQNRLKDWTRMAEALSILTMALEEEPCDFLGNVSTELGLNDSKWRGQCFTPSSVCNLMAEMQLENAKPQDDRTAWLAEPACGGGAMLIAADNVLKRNGFYPWHYHWHATDIDWKCYAMTFLQLSLLGIPAQVTWGNTLSLQYQEHARTLASLLHPPKPTHQESDMTEQELQDILGGDATTQKPSVEFALKNDPPKTRQARFPDPERTVQKTMFTGLNCLSGQQDLIET